MNEEEFKLLLQEGETHEVEFKESLSNLDKEIVAFANSLGGKILLGIKDDGTVRGVVIDNLVKSQIQDIANNCEPSVKIELDKFKDVLIINVPEGKNKPYMCKGGFYIRLGPNSQKLPRDEIMKFAIKEGSIRYDEQINREFDFQRDFDERRFIDFLRASKITINLPFQDILTNMGLAEASGNRYYFKNAVPLFFSKDVKKFSMSAYTTCVLFKENNRAEVIDRKDFDGSLIEQVEDAIRFIEKNVMLTYQIKKLVRKEVLQYPLPAIREGIVNAIMHRDYFEKGSNVFVYIYSDFIEIVNPGGLFGITNEQLGRVCSRRNERIADLFKMVGLVEKAGTGIQRMKDAMLETGLREPKIEAMGNFFMISFYGHKKENLGEIAEGKDAVRLNERQKKGLEYAKEEGRVTTAEYMKINKANRRTSIRDLTDLVGKKILKVAGGRLGKERHYVLM